MRGLSGVSGGDLEQLLGEGVAAGVYSGAVALVGKKGELRWQGAAGRTSSHPDSPPVTADTLFDLASLTKPLATTLALMCLAAQGRLALPRTLGEVLPVPWLPPDKRPLSLGSLLAHRAGLPAWRPFYRELLAAPPELRSLLLPRLAAAEPLEYEPDTATLYSDLGFMLLQAVVEEISGRNLAEFCHQELYAPLGLNTLGFNPRHHPTRAAHACAATEAGLIPGRPLSGEVHDENAWAAGGVAGHAGLFGTGPEVFALAARLYRTYHGESALGAIPPEVVRQFFTPPAPGARALGFDVVSPGQSSAGRYFSPRSVGHTGFTGTSFWIDLEKGQMVVLLTNRVHLGRHHDAIKAFRPRFHEAASACLGLTS